MGGQSLLKLAARPPTGGHQNNVVQIQSPRFHETVDKIGDDLVQKRVLPAKVINGCRHARLMFPYRWTKNLGRSEIIVTILASASRGRARRY